MGVPFNLESQLDELPATYWLLGIDSDTLRSLLWAVGEYIIRNSDHPRAIGGVKGMHEVVQRRKMEPSWAPEVGLHAYSQEGNVPVRNLELLLASHEARTINSEEDLEAMCTDQGFLSEVAIGKYTRFFDGDWKEALVYAYCAGQIAKEEWQYPPSARQKRFLGMLKERAEAGSVDEALLDFRRALAM